MLQCAHDQLHRNSRVRLAGLPGSLSRFVTACQRQSTHSFANFESSDFHVPASVTNHRDSVGSHRIPRHGLYDVVALWRLSKAGIRSIGSCLSGAQGWVLSSRSERACKIGALHASAGVNGAGAMTSLPRR